MAGMPIYGLDASSTSVLSNSYLPNTLEEGDLHSCQQC